MILCKVILDTCPFILGYIAEYPWMLSFLDFARHFSSSQTESEDSVVEGILNQLSLALGIALLQLTLLLPLGWRCLPFGAAKISFFTGFPQASFIHRQKRYSEKQQPYRNTRHLLSPRAASVGPAVPFLPFGKRESSGRAAPPGTPENPSFSLFALFRPQTLGTAPDIPKTYRARNIYI